MAPLSFGRESSPPASPSGLPERSRPTDSRNRENERRTRDKDSLIRGHSPSEKERTRPNDDEDMTAPWHQPSGTRSHSPRQNSRFMRDVSRERFICRSVVVHLPFFLVFFFFFFFSTRDLTFRSGAMPSTRTKSQGWRIGDYNFPVCWQ